MNATPPTRLATWIARWSLALIAVLAMTGTLPGRSALAQSGFRVADIGERSLDDAPALAVVVSRPLDPTVGHDRHLEVRDAEGLTVRGAWVLADNQRVLYFPGIEPERTYTVEVRATLTAADGSRLGQAVTRQIETRRLVPVASFASQGLVLPRDIARGLPVVSVNVDAVDVEFLRVVPERLAAFLAHHGQSARTSVWSLDQMTRLAPVVYSGRFDLPVERNRRGTSMLPVLDLPALSAPGLYVAAMKPAGRFEEAYQTAWFFVSDIGLMARQYPTGIAVFASSLTGAGPLAGVTLRSFDAKGRSLDQAVTDEQGRARLGHFADATLLVASRGEDMALLPLVGPGLDLSEHPVTGRRWAPRDIFTWGPRDLYRPGETVELSVLLRDDDGRPVPAQPIEARLVRPDGRQVSTWVWRPDADGYLRHRHDLPTGAQTGTWTVEMRLDPSAAFPLERHAFRVEEFLPERLALDLEAPAAPLAPGAPMAVDVVGRYLYGAPAAGNRLDTVATWRHAPRPLETLPGFFFGDVDGAPQPGRQDLGSIELDQAGKGSVAFEPPVGSGPAPVEVRMVASLLETGGRPVVRDIRRLVWPGEAMIGVRLVGDDDTVPPDGTARFEVVLARADGALLAAPALDLTLIREQRDYYWVYEEGGGWRSEYTTTEYPVETRRVTVPADGRATVELPVRDGAYRLELRDPRGGPPTRYRFFAGWSWQSDASMHGASRPDRVALTLDREAYRPGDVARLTIEPPHAGEAVILVESDRLLASRRLAVGTAATTIDLPVGIDWARHDIYVTVVVLRPASAADAITPSRALGVLHLPLDRRDRRLALELDAPSEIRPQSRLAVAVRAPDAAGQAVRVALAAVDVGVLSITDFETPDPVAFFFGRRQLAADARDLYGRLIEGQGGDRALLRFGGDGDATAGGPRPDAKVEIVALSAEPVRLDASGSATVELAVPYFNGRLRLMAVAFGPDGVGSGERELTVAAPVVAELSTPRFLAPGDRSELTVDLHNRTDAAVPLRLSLGATGPVVIGAGPTTVEVAAGARTTLRYPLLGADAFGVGEVRVAVVGPEVVALRTRELGVRPAWPGETRRARHRIEPGVRVDLEPRLADGLMPETVRAALTLSEHPPLALETALDGLLRYPYGCLEQTVSRARPLLWADAALAGRLGLEPVPADRRQRWVEAAIERVGSLQLGGGGFGLWSERSEAEPWLTPYAVDFLLDARAAGHAVPTAMLDAAVTHLQRRLRAGVDVGRYSESPAHLAFASQAYAAYVLSRIGKAPLGTIRALYDREHARAESLLPLMHIGLALAAQGDRRRGAEALTRAFATSRPPRTYLGDYGSDVRDLAAGVALLAGQSQPLPGGDALAFRLADALANRRWLSTQEQAAVLAAGRALLARAPSGFDARIESAGEARAVAGEGVRREVLAAERLSAGVAVANEGENPLWVAVSAAGYAAERPAPTREGDLLVERVLRSMDGRPLDASAGLAVGEQVLVQLRVRARETIEHALVVDLLPAGLEIAIADLGSGEAASELTVDGRPVGELQASTRHVEYREDRYAAALPLMAGSTADLFYLARAVTPGEYRVPPPGVEDMYRPDIRALGEAPDRLTVRAR